MIRAPLASTCVLLLATGTANAQSLQRRVLDTPDGTVEFTFAARAGVCGDGATYVHDGFGGQNRISDGGNFNGRGNDVDWPPCLEGPVRVLAFVNGGEITRLRTFAGPRRPLREASTSDLGTVPVEEVADFLSRTIERAQGRASTDAVLPLILADSIDPWPTLLRFARDDRASRATRGSVNFWLARGAAAKLGVVDRDDGADDDVRASAVFALSQQPKDVSVPRLIDLVHTSSHPGVRTQALFWLGQSNDQRAIDLFEEILRGRRER